VTTTPLANPTVVGTPGNVLTGHVQMYIAPVGTAAPAITVAYGGDWGSGWLPSGYSEKGLTFNVDRKTNMIYVEELATPVDVVVDTDDVSIDFDFAEDSLQSMLWAYGGGLIATVAGTSPTPTTSTLTLSDTLAQVAVGFEGTAPAGNFRRVVVPQMISSGKVKTVYQRAKAPRSYPATFTCISAIDLISIVEIGSAVEAQ